MFNEFVGIETFKAGYGLIGYRKVFDTSFVKPLTGADKQISYAEDVRSGFVKALKYTSKTLREGADAYLEEGVRFDPKSASNKCAAAAECKYSNFPHLSPEQVEHFAGFLAQLDTPALLHKINREWFRHPGEQLIPIIFTVMWGKVANADRLPEGCMSSFYYEYLAYLAPAKYGRFHKTYKNVAPKELKPEKPKAKHIIKDEL